MPMKEYSLLSNPEKLDTHHRIQFSYLLFVTASHQTGPDTRSMIIGGFRRGEGQARADARTQQVYAGHRPTLCNVGLMSLAGLRPSLVSYSDWCILICMHKHNNDTIKTSDTILRKIYLSLYLKGSRVGRSWRPNRTATYWPPLYWP